MNQHNITGAARVVAAADLTTPALVLTAVPWSQGPLAVPITKRRRRNGRVVLTVEGGGELDVSPAQPLLVIEAVQ